MFLKGENPFAKNSVKIALMYMLSLSKLTLIYTVRIFFKNFLHDVRKRRGGKIACWEIMAFNPLANYLRDETWLTFSVCVIVPKFEMKLKF